VETGADVEEPIAGTRVGRYEIVRRLASGGMGEVFLARAKGVGGFSKSVALKRLRTELAADPSFVAMFLDEARIAAMLDHSNIVQTIDVVLDGGTAWIVMEYLRGADVAELVRLLEERGRAFPVGAAVGVAVAVADALHYAHERLDEAGAPLDVVHRDVSPANVIVTLDGTVKVVDFGIARANVRATETAVGTVKGKLLYMSPEQCRGERIDRRSDVFSLGVTLYEMLTGTPPHVGADEYELRKAIVEGVVLPPSSRVPSVPDAIDDIVLGCLAKRPADRPKSAGALAASLLEVAERRGWDLSPFALARIVKDAERGAGNEAEPPHRSSITLQTSRTTVERPPPTAAPTAAPTASQTSSSVVAAPRARIAPWPTAALAAVACAAGVLLGRSGSTTETQADAKPKGTNGAPSAPPSVTLADAPREVEPRTVVTGGATSAEPPVPSIGAPPAAVPRASAAMPRPRPPASQRPTATTSRPPPDPDAPLPR
jgi:serine/threonine protein kinase